MEEQHPRAAEQRISGLWPLPCPRTLRGDRGWRAGYDPAAGPLVPDLSGGVWKLLGKTFIAYSAVAAVGFSGAYWVCEQFAPLWPGLAQMPLAASILGAVFVGVGVGLCVRAGGAPSGDDALAMSVSHVTGLKLQWVYLITDLLVLGLSLTYIPLNRIGYSLLSVLLSGQIIGWVQRAGKGKASAGK